MINVHIENELFKGTITRDTDGTICFVTENNAYHKPMNYKVLLYLECEEDFKKEQLKEMLRIL